MPERDKKNVCKFFHALPYVLPCKFCRASLSEYIIEDPIEDACESPLALQKWLWRVHNRVSEKLNKKFEPPSFSAVSKIYKEKLEQGCSRTVFDGWEFLFSIAEHHPFSRGNTYSPIEGAPPLEELTTPLLRNRWNVMRSEERIEFYNTFWNILPSVLPFDEWRKGWGSIECETRKDTLASLWRIRSALENELELLNKTTYSSLCKLLQSVRSGCGSKTCRKKRNI